MYEFTGGAVPTLEALQHRVARQTRPRPPGIDWLNWVVRRGDTVVGVVQATVTVTDDGDHAEVAWEIGVPWQGRGYAKEAAVAVVDWLAGGVTEIRANIHQDHVASQAVATAAGLRPTDTTVGGETRWQRQI
jgi:RimJ/RimL family protein N-acetyltransferase